MRGVGGVTHDRHLLAVVGAEVVATAEVVVTVDPDLQSEMVVVQNAMRGDQGAAVTAGAQRGALRHPREGSAASPLTAAGARHLRTGLTATDLTTARARGGGMTAGARLAGRAQARLPKAGGIEALRLTGVALALGMRRIMATTALRPEEVNPLDEKP